MANATGSAQVRLVTVFLVLVFLPSVLLVWFALRAVDAERKTRAGRIIEDREQFARLAARAAHHELSELESAWSDLLPLRLGVAPPGAALLAERHVRACLVLEGKTSAVPSAAEARAFAARFATGELAEFERNEPAAAAVAYRAAGAAARNPRLRAIALASQSRAELAAGDAAGALRSARRLRAHVARLFDLDDQPLDLVAQLQEARALDALRDSTAVAAWLALADSAVARAGELGAAQVAFFRSRAEEASRPHAPAGLAARSEAWQSAERAATRGDAFFAHKLDHRLLRAVTDEQRWSPRLRYLSDVVDGEPYLVVYRLLPDVRQERVAGIAGLIVDLPRLSAAVLPGFLQDLELSHEARLTLVDDAGRRVVGDLPHGIVATPAARFSLGEPFEFWNIAVHVPEGPPGPAVDLRTRAYLTVLGVLLLTIVAGAVLVVRGVRRESRLAALKTSFVSNVSHELRTPLASIRMYAEMLDSGGDRMADAERRRQLGVIRAECSRLERLIDAVLDFAALQRGTRQLRFEFEEIGALVQAVAEEFREQAESRGFEYHVEIAPDLPEARIDADAIRQVLLNLLSNAMKYSEENRWIAVRAFGRDQQVVFEVEDHGIGIEPANQRRIFDEFFRVDQSLASARQGLGLGLTLVRRIVEAHRGRVHVESAPGRGACFSVWLPIDAAATGPIPAAIPQEAGS